MSKQRIDLIRQALSASESSIRLARQLLSELERETTRNNKQPTKDIPGIQGIYDGQEMISEKGEKFPVPENYSSKSILVVGDTLKLVDEGGKKRFKQIEHVKRHKTTGILTKKEGKWAAVTPEGSYKLIPAAVEYFGGSVGDEALLQLPAGNLQTTWAAVENISKKDGGEVKKEESNKRPLETKEAENEEKQKVEVSEKEKTEKIEDPKKEEKTQPKEEKSKKVPKLAQEAPKPKVETKESKPEVKKEEPKKVELSTQVQIPTDDELR